MNFVRLLPVVLSLLLLAAHFSRAGLPALVILTVAFLPLLLVRRPWIARITQLVLVLGAMEWFRATVFYILDRRARGDDWGRLALILGTVIVVTLASGLIFQHPKIRQRYRMD